MSTSRFLANVIAFLLPVLAGLAWLEAATASLPTTYAKKHDLLARAAGRVETLVLGDSHAYFGLDPHRLPGWAFNMANVSQPLAIDAALLERLLPGLPRLRRVVWGLSYHAPRTELAATTEAWRLAFYERTFGIPAPAPWYAPSHHSWIALYGDPRGAAKELLGAAADRELFEGFDQHGAVLPRPRRTAAIDDAEAALVVRLQEQAMTAEALPRNQAAVERALALAAARHVAVTFVTLPVTRAYARHASPARVAEARALAHGFAGARYLDHFADPAFADADFMDPDHLAPTGARKLAARLAGELP